MIGHLVLVSTSPGKKPHSVLISGYLWQPPGYWHWRPLSWRSWPLSPHCPGWSLLTNIGSPLRYLNRRQHTDQSPTDPNSAWSCNKCYGPCVSLVSSEGSPPWIPWGALRSSIALLLHGLPPPETSWTVGRHPLEWQSTLIPDGWLVSATTPAMNHCLRYSRICGDPHFGECDSHTPGQVRGLPQVGLPLPCLPPLLCGPPGILSISDVRLAVARLGVPAAV